ncbi:MAG: hypothetical protein J6K53_00045 [Roseburia sp.]|nr:hypothetical protein [Roseburia sp.]
MRHCYIRGILAVVWIAIAAVYAVRGEFVLAGLDAVIGASFIYSAYDAWKKNGKGDRE